MKKLFILLALVLSTFTHQAEAKKIALLIGVSKYPASSKWCRLNSSTDVEMLQESLKKSGFVVTTLCDEKATHDNILTAIGNISCQRGDMVLIHFSGHGQRMTDVNGDEDDHYTEAFIPYDAKMTAEDGYCGANHLTDDEIHGILIPIRNKLGTTGQLLVTIDACHSADSTRGDDGLIIRGTDEIFKVGKPYLLHNRLNNDAATGFEISACQSDQLNRQYKYNGEQQCGSLSYLLNEGIKKQGKNLNFNKLADYIKKNYKKVMVKPQKPNIQPL